MAKKAYYLLFVGENFSYFQHIILQCDIRGTCSISTALIVIYLKQYSDEK